MASEEKVPIPPELENMLLEFTINVIVENPDDLVGHAADYFAKLRDKKQLESSGETTDQSKEFIEGMLGSRAQVRRGTVIGESYNPEEDNDEDSHIEVFPKTDEERQGIKQRIADIFLFRVLDDEDMSAVIDAMVKKTVKEGDVIIKQGDDGDFFYLIDDGCFDIFIEDQVGEVNRVGTYDNEGFFGELALLHNQPRAATIKAVSDGLLWAVDRRTFNRLIVKRAFEKRQTYMKLLNEVSQLQSLTEYERMQVADALVPKSYSTGDVIVSEGDEGDGMYFIVQGKVSVRQKKTTDEGVTVEEIAQLDGGDFFGGM